MAAAEALVLPLQSDALSGALHPAPAQHGTKVLRARTQDRPRNPVKQLVSRQIHQSASPFTLTECALSGREEARNIIYHCVL